MRHTLKSAFDDARDAADARGLSGAYALFVGHDYVRLRYR